MIKRAFLAGGALAVAVFLTPLQAWEAARSTVAKGIRVSFSVLPVAAFDLDHGQRSAPADPPSGVHRIVVQLTERKSGRHVSEAELVVIVTSGDYASGPLRMVRANAGGRVYFETTVAYLPRKALYQVDFRLAGAPSVTSVQFDYRHGR